MPHAGRTLTVAALSLATCVAASNAAPVIHPVETTASGSMSIPKTLKIVVRNTLPATPSDGGYGVQGYPRVSLRSGQFSCWNPGDIIALNATGRTAPAALAKGGTATFVTETLTGVPLLPSPCKPMAIMLPHILNYTVVIQEGKGAPWEVARSSATSNWDLLGWTPGITPTDPSAGFLATIPPTGTNRTTATRTVCVSGSGYLMWPLNSLYTNDTLTLTVAEQCPAPAAAPADGGPGPAQEAWTVPVGLKAGTRVRVPLGSAGESWRLVSCSGARASAPRRIDRGAVVASDVGRTTPGIGRCLFNSSGGSPDAVVTVEVRARR